ncbi:MAG: tRNA (adenosine(37)-N6)-threonylcarbamoyltransferase complex ATPase subunit type 1 TsaE [Bacilli bacterium]
MKQTFVLHSLAELPTLLKTLMPVLTLGTLVTLTGPLGVGKTTIVQAIVRQLGYQGHVGSPTFTIMKLYPLMHGRLLHVDAYRLEGAAGFGLEDEMGEDTITFIEWPEKLTTLPYAKHQLHLTLSFLEGPTRLVTIKEEVTSK